MFLEQKRSHNALKRDLSALGKERTGISCMVVGVSTVLILYSASKGAGELFFLSAPCKCQCGMCHMSYVIDVIN